MVDIKDPKFPVLKESYVMKNPHGLALTGEHLYVCEGTFGMKSFKVSDVSKIDKNLLENLEDFIDELKRAIGCSGPSKQCE